MAKHNFDQASSELRQNILTFYADPKEQIASKNAKAWKTTREQLIKLKATTNEYSLDTASIDLVQGSDH